MEGKKLSDLLRLQLDLTEVNRPDCGDGRSKHCWVRGFEVAARQDKVVDLEEEDSLSWDQWKTVLTLIMRLTLRVSSTEKKREPHWRSFNRLPDKSRSGTWKIFPISQFYQLWSFPSFTCARPGPRMFGWTFGKEKFFKAKVFSPEPSRWKLL